MSADAPTVPRQSPALSGTRPAFGHFKDVHQSVLQPEGMEACWLPSRTSRSIFEAGQLVDPCSGRAGCGKTTFLKIVAGLIAGIELADTVQINGRDVHRAARRISVSCSSRPI